MDWYRDILSEPDDFFRLNKHHFYFSKTNFYNFPCLFGYPFSMDTYTRRHVMGKEFFDRYKAFCWTPVV